MTRSRAGTPLDKVRDPISCTECGVSFDPGRGTATKRCPACREKWLRERPDRKASKRKPEPCIDCGQMIEPTVKGKIAKRCPTCRRTYLNSQARERRRSGQYAMNVGRGEPSTRPTKPKCEVCGSELPKPTRGPARRLCDECKRRRRNAYRRKTYEAKQAARPWLKEMECLDCGASIPPAPPGNRRPQRCSECLPKHRKPFLKDPAKQRDKHLRRMFGITQVDYEKMLASQGGACAICGSTTRRFHIDHDHATGKIRAILCQHCNQMLGHARDSAATLRSAADYLELHDAQEIPEDEVWRDWEPQEPEDFEEMKYGAETQPFQ